MIRKICFILFFQLCLAVPATGADFITVAVAANFATTLEGIVQLYEKRYGRDVRVTIASSGTLYAQLSNGAPYDIFLSADAERPNRLHENGICGKPFIYARGNAVFWSKKLEVLTEDNWQEAARSALSGRIAVANPKVAPYGRTVLPLITANFSAEDRTRLVYGQNVAQAFQFAQMGVVDGAFTSLSFALSPEGNSGRYWEIPEAEAVEQRGCIVAEKDTQKRAAEFIRVLLSEETQEMIREHGYL